MSAASQACLPDCRDGDTRFDVNVWDIASGWSGESSGMGTTRSGIGVPDTLGYILSSNSTASTDAMTMLIGIRYTAVACSIRSSFAGLPRAGSGCTLLKPITVNG